METEWEKYFFSEIFYGGCDILLGAPWGTSVKIAQGLFFFKNNFFTLKKIGKRYLDKKLLKETSFDIKLDDASMFKSRLPR